jgi:hypothetical protein
MPHINDENLYNGYLYSTTQTKYIDENYSHINIESYLIDFLLETCEAVFLL